MGVLARGRADRPRSINRTGGSQQSAGFNSPTHPQYSIVYRNT